MPADLKKWSWLQITFGVIPFALAIATGSSSLFRDFIRLRGVEIGAETVFWTWLRICFVFAFAVTWMQQQRKIKAFEAQLLPQLDIIFDGNNLPYVMPMKATQEGRTNKVGHLYRVGIKNLSTQTIERVEVELAEIDPPIMGCVPAPLHLMNDNSNFNSTAHAICFRSRCATYGGCRTENSNGR